MNTKTKITLGAIIVLAVVILGAYNYKGTTSTRNETTNATSTAYLYPSENKATTTASAANGTATGKLSFGEFIKRGGTYICTFSGAINATTTAKGTVYMDKGNVRGDVILSTKTGKGGASFIAKNGYIYYWNSAMPAGQGIKLKYDMTSYKPGDFDQFDQAGNYECKPWTPDSSKFTLPASIIFQ